MLGLTRLIFILSLSSFLISCEFKQERTGAVCNDGWRSTATGQGACSHHDGVKYWTYD